MDNPQSPLRSGSPGADMTAPAHFRVRISRVVMAVTGEGPELVTCDMTRAELIRAVRRGALERLQRAREVLVSLTVMTLPTATFEEAGRLDHPLLRTLDAVHVAAALLLGDDLESLVTYEGERRPCPGNLNHGTRLAPPHA